jgi:hypothetical protein
MAAYIMIPIVKEANSIQFPDTLDATSTIDMSNAGVMENMRTPIGHLSTVAEFAMNALADTLHPFHSRPISVGILLYPYMPID